MKTTLVSIRRPSFASIRMKRKTLHIALSTFLLVLAHVAKAQTYTNDFENGYTWYPPWENIRIVTDTVFMEQNDEDAVAIDTVLQRYCVCHPDQEFGLGFSYEFPDSLQGNNLNLAFHADYRFPDTLAEGQLAFSIKRLGKVLFWQSYDLKSYANEPAEWFSVSVNLNFPADHLPGSTIQFYLWNEHQQHILIDNASVTLTPWTMPSFLLGIRHDSITDDSFVLRLHDSLQTPLTYPIGVLTEYILDGDSISEFHLFTEKGDLTMAVSGIDTTFLILLSEPKDTPELVIGSHFFKECLLLRQAIVVPFIDSTVTVYRRNMKTENGTPKGSPTEWEVKRRTENGKLPQREYYLDREGFKVGEGERSVISYHQLDISSTQFDADNGVAYFNLNYWRDHPLIHYPLSDTLDNVFEDRSSCQVYDGMEWTHFIPLHIGKDVQHLPRIMPIPFGYESGIIFTEHADWTDIRTHRAVLFGSEKITKAKDAVGGFVYYGIPVTKSVFYNNPDQVTNEGITQGAFKGLHSTIKTDREFEKLLKQLHKLDFDICLHTPEQYTTTPNNLKEALDYMQRHFKSTTWIDHGYNNGITHNREDMVCDGLNRQSEHYAASQWRRHGIKYLWNAYYEENRMESWSFNNNLTQPYPGFGDALPNRQITLLTENGERRTESPQFFTWCTPATLEASTDADWDYFFSEERLQRLVDNHGVYINHTYPAWVWPGRTFWTYDADSTIVALPGMNRALERIARLRDEHKILPMTVKTYLDYYSKLLKVNYSIIDSDHIQLKNIGGEEIKGFTLLCPTPIRFEDNRYYEFRKSGNEYYLWFDLKTNDQVTIRIINN